MDSGLDSVREGLRGMDPGYFALVMATGIVSNAFLYLSRDRRSDVLFGITLVAFPCSSPASLVRMLVRPRAVWGDLVDPRLVFFLPVDAAEMNTLFWVVMGAAAIATNAGSTLILTEPDLPFLLAMRPFVNGTTLILWAWATWWIPLLAIFGVWRHLVRRYPLMYAPMYWSLVFPLGMYAVATYRLSLASDFEPIELFSQVMVWVALGAWVATMAGLLGSVRARVQAVRLDLR